MPLRILKVAIDFFARREVGAWPVILARVSSTVSVYFLSSRFLPTPHETINLELSFSIENDLGKNNVTRFEAYEKIRREVTLSSTHDTYMILSIAESYTTRRDGHRIYDFTYSIESFTEPPVFNHILRNRVPISWKRFSDIDDERRRNFPYL